MAFLPPAPLRPPGRVATPPLTRHPPPYLHPRPRTRPCATAPAPDGPASADGAAAPAAAPSSVISIPSSLCNASSQATEASRLAFSRGLRRLFIEVDLTAGDATYTLLKSTLPLVQLLFPLLDDASRAAQPRVHLVLPDAGAAALARRDFPDVPSHITLCGMEQVQMDVENDAGLIIVAPRASDVERLCVVVEGAAACRVVIVNPDLVDMGVTGLSLNARRLRQRLIDTFETAYYLKTFEWGVLLRAYPGKWGIWTDEPGSAIGFRLVGQVDKRPGPDTIDEIFEGDEGARGLKAGPLQKVWRFLSLYMKG